MRQLVVLSILNGAALAVVKSSTGVPIVNDDEPTKPVPIWDDTVYNSWTASYQVEPNTDTCDITKAELCFEGSKRFGTFAQAQTCFSKLMAKEDSKPCLVKLTNKAIATEPSDPWVFDDHKYLVVNPGIYHTSSKQTDNVTVLDALDSFNGVKFQLDSIKFGTTAHQKTECNTVRIATFPRPLFQVETAKPFGKPTLLKNQSSITILPDVFKFQKGQLDEIDNVAEKMFVAIPQTNKNRTERFLCNWPPKSIKPEVTLVGTVEITKTSQEITSSTSYRLEPSSQCKPLSEECSKDIADDQHLLDCLESARAHLCTIRIIKIFKSTGGLNSVLSTDKQTLVPSISLPVKLDSLSLNKPQPHIVQLQITKVDFLNQKFSRTGCNYANLTLSQDNKKQVVPFKLPNSARVPKSIIPSHQSILVKENKEIKETGSAITMSVVPVRPSTACVWPVGASDVTVELSSMPLKYYSVSNLPYDQSLWKKTYFIQTSCGSADICSNQIHTALDTLEKCLDKITSAHCSYKIIAQATIDDNGTAFSGIKYSNSVVPILRLDSLYENIRGRPLKLKAVMFGAQFSRDSAAKKCNHVNIVHLKPQLDLNDQLLDTDLDLEHKLSARLPNPIIFDTPLSDVAGLVAIPTTNIKCVWETQSTKPAVILTTDLIKP